MKQQKYYTIAFVDKTSNGALSNARIKTGSGKDKQDSIGEQIAGQIGNKLIGQAVSSASSAAGFNLAPAFNLGKSILAGAGGGAIASAGISLITQIVSFIWSSVSARIAELRQEAAQANERDNTLILSGSLDISGCTIKKGKYGRDEYVYNRG